MEITKKCKKCGTDKKLEEFRKQTANFSGFGRKNICRECDDYVQQMRYQQKRVTILQQVKEWQTKNPEKVKLYKEKWRSKTKIN